ncbi:uncharacterized protein LOC121869312 [Homarus americanus]|uniref:uncharacterized protein LOC121863491 n=1 Tax=Homarus americanus TaxID=6706 RepID=UPI001C438424|nr:uncharacterized protein LOC121863491 [Homarus americanus]XP_042218099.1 uncharacterized protein LOC121863491 [Homarus americanus]XP_042218100.1 uncharacterized protein LOC121863491 [Homarus americanus]XP_042218101.1 uncharacterized protein LOC121863491 [Homarus americanus]XP_042218102.1 uncharacterized protein LOC121863491 [Homarus americanus]XP_042218103.1 uncharacterized protein LOC121863491 [Homarus americanus]XP_042226499.1 uncharacterized protein LOC121869312 [Homarus americanus]XP_0
MAMFGAVTLKSVIVWGALFATAWFGDNLVKNFILDLPPKSLLRATDTVVHGLIGGFSFWLTCLLCPDLVLDVSYLLSCLGLGHERDRQRRVFLDMPIDTIYNFGVAFMLSCVVDLDHVMKDLVQIIMGGSRVPWERGCLHFSLPPLLLTLLLYISALIVHYMWCLKLGTLIVVCIFSHQVRDGMHHGLWFQPLGITSRLPQWLYIFITQILPLVISALVSILVLRVKLNVNLSREMYFV